MSSSPPTSSNGRDVVIVSAVRTPLCRSRKGSFAKTPPSTLLSAAFRGCIDRVAAATTGASSSSSSSLVEAKDIQDICVGNVLCPSSGTAGFRMAQIECGIPHTTSLSSVNRQCSSGLQAVANIANAIACGDIDIGIGAGVESMSFYPMTKQSPPDVDWDRMNSCGEAMDCLTPMGITSENVTRQYGLERDLLDAFATESHARAAKAQSSGKFRQEIVPVGDVENDDGIRPKTTKEILAKLKPVFDENGSTTAGNSSQTTDGAAAVLLMTRDEARARNIKILATWKAFAVKGVPPRIMGVGPAAAIPAVLSKAGLNKHDVAVYEINEAFASQASWCIHELGLDHAKVNPNGGAIALGHPLGCTGARQIATILAEMHREGHRYGVVSMCVGTGMGAAAVLEAEPSLHAPLSKL